MTKLSKIISELKQPYVVLLIGPPMSGKTYEVSKILEELPEHNIEVLSNDETLLEVYGSRDNYNEAYKNVSQKKLKMVFNKEFLDANKDKRNVIIDMTQMRSKRRKTNLKYFTSDYYKLGVIFPILSDEEYVMRNEKRTIEEHKNISMGIVKNMINTYQVVNEEDEGFDKVISL